MADVSALPWEERANGMVATKEEKRNEANSSRVTVRLSGELGKTIENLQEITSSSTPSEVVRRAIVVYHTLVQQKLRGNEPVIEVREGSETKKIPIFL
jgi:hypothetical protein